LWLKGRSAALLSTGAALLAEAAAAVALLAAASVCEGFGFGFEHAETRARTRTDRALRIASLSGRRTELTVTCT
jgi:hypothetical protein